MNSGPTLQIGSTGPDVRRLQILFVMTKLLDYTGIDGSFGSQTQAAVKSFQQSSNLTADGVVGPATWNALPADPNTPRLARGSTGSVVSALQKSSEGVRYCKQSNRSWAHRWRLWPED